MSTSARVTARAILLFPVVLPVPAQRGFRHPGTDRPRHTLHGSQQGGRSISATDHLLPRPEIRGRTGPAQKGGGGAVRRGRGLSTPRDGTGLLGLWGPE